MNTRDTRRYEMLVRVRDFGVAHADRFPPDGRGGQAFAAVAAAVASLTQHALSHFSGRGSAREGTTSKQAAREALREDIEAIARTAHAVAIDTPGLDERFRAPRGGGDQTLLNAARAFAADAAPFAALFIEHDLPDDFLEDLDTDIKDFEEATRDRHEGKDTTVAAQAAIEEAMEAGFAALRRLDAVVPNRLRDDVPAIAVWERARRIGYRSARAASESPDAAASGEAAVV